MKEVAVAAVVVRWLEADGWDVYQEVDNIDIVATRGPIVSVVEVKTSLSWKLCAQAFSRMPYAHEVWVAVPVKPSSATPWYARRCLGRDGIGILEVSDMVNVGLPATLHRSAHAGAKLLRARLRPEHKTHLPAGSACGGGWTPFKDTSNQLRKLIDAEPDGVPVKTAIESISHHYRGNSSARACLVKLARDGVIDGVRVIRDGKRILFVASKFCDEKGTR